MSARFQRPRRRNFGDETTSRKSPRLTQKEQNVSAYRLSRVPAKFAQNKAIEQEKSESIMEDYYKNHPNEPIDKRTPDEKYEEIQTKLEDENLTEEEKLPLYIQERMLNFIKYGENSVESFRSYLNVGICYNRTHRQTSAIRNFEKAHQLESCCEPLDYERLLLAVETAEAHMILYSQDMANGKESDANKHINKAQAIIEPAKDSEVEDQELSYRKDLAIAHIYTIKKMYKEAMPFYESGVKGYENAYDDIDDGLASLAVQAAENAENVGKEDKEAVEAKYKFYQKAYDTYVDLGMDEEAEAIKPKLVREKEEEEEEEEKANKEEEEDKKSKGGEEEDKRSTSHKGEEEENRQEYEENQDGDIAATTYQTQDDRSYQYRDPDQDYKEEEEQQQYADQQQQSGNQSQRSFHSEHSQHSHISDQDQQPQYTNQSQIEFSINQNPDQEEDFFEDDNRDFENGGNQQDYQDDYYNQSNPEQ